MPTVDQIRADLAAAGTQVYSGRAPGYTDRIYFFELADPGPEESFVGSEFRGARTFRVFPYAGRWAFCTWMLGWSYLMPGESAKAGAGVLRHLPQPYPLQRPSLGPDVPSTKPIAYAADILRVKGVTPQAYIADSGHGAATNTISPAPDYQYADVQVAYSALPYPLVTDAAMVKAVPGSPNAGDLAAGQPDESSLARYVSRVLRPGGKHLQYPAGQLTWESDGSTTGQTVGKMLQYVDIDYVWHRVPAVPEAVYTAGVSGGVNLTAFDDLIPGTLLLLGADVSPERQVSGSRGYRVTYRTRYFRPEGDKGHNFFPRWKTDSGGATLFIYDKPRLKTAAGPPAVYATVFPAFDFATLFRGPWRTGSGWTD